MAYYHTVFPVAQNPISEGNAWPESGAGTGIDWTNIQTVAGVASGTQPPASGFTDSLAVLSGFAPDVTAAGTIVINSATLPGDTHEVEILLRFSIGPHDAHGYECNYAWDGAYTQIVRWNGALGDFTMIQDTGGPSFGAPQTGDQLEAKISGNIITVTMIRSGVRTVVNTADITSVGGTVWKNGNPGIGSWHANSTQNYGFTSYTASDGQSSSVFFGAGTTS